MVLFGSGGHSSEMMMLIQNANLSKRMDLKEINRLICVVSEDDKLIGEKMKHEFRELRSNNKLETVALRRGRKVGQSYLTSIWTTIVSIIHSINLILTYKPKLCLTNGPAVGVTMAVAIRCLQLATCCLGYSCQILYIESFCRTKTLSLSGKLIYHLRLADQFYVQWPELSARYGRARYEGILV